MNRCPVSLLFLLLPCLLIQAQIPEETVSIHFQVLAWASLPAEHQELYYHHQGKDVRLEAVHTTLRSRNYAYNGPRTLAFFTKKTDPSGEERRTVLGRVTLNPQIRNLLLILMPKAGGGLEILPLPDDVDNFPMGSYRFFNFTKSRFAVQVGDELQQIPYRGSVLFRQADSGDKGLVLKMAKQEDGEWEIYHQTVLPHREDRRVMLFLVEKEQRGRSLVQMRQLVDYASELPPPPPAEDTP